MKFAVLLLFTVPFFVKAQPVIKGRVVDENTGVPIVSASVFISSTSKGTVTNNQGEFSLSGIPSGKYDLVVSSVGYHTNVFSFSENDLPIQLKIELRVKVKELETVVVEPSTEEGWDKWGKSFITNFLGTTPNAAQCKIKNTDALKFRFFRKSNRLIAYSDEPLQIENNALGYEISYRLEEFEVNFKEQSCFYTGYPLFTSKATGGNMKPRWKKKRNECWNGSIMHFMASLYSDSLAENGFFLRRMFRQPNAEKQRIRMLYKKVQQGQQTISVSGGNIISFGFPAGTPADSVNYYQQVLNQPDFIDTYGTAFLTADSLLIDSIPGNKALYFEQYLFVTYTGEKEDPEFVLGQRPLRKPGAQRSWVNLLDGNPIIFDRYGNYSNPRHFFTSGYWAWSEKMGDTLPLDYWQEK